MFSSQTSKSLLSMALLSIASAVFAADPLPPKECPSLDLIMHSGSILDGVMHYESNYAVYSKSKFYTAGRKWTVMVIPVVADDEQGALKKARIIVEQTTMGDKIPFHHDAHRYYYCRYVSQSNVRAYSNDDEQGGVSFNP